jgi:hypothetical protein
MHEVRGSSPLPPTIRGHAGGAGQLHNQSDERDTPRRIDPREPPPRQAAESDGITPDHGTTRERPVNRSGSAR